MILRTQLLSKRAVLVPLLLLVLGLGIGLFDSTFAAQETPRDGGTLIIALPKDPVTLDPSFAIDSYSLQIVDQMFDTLVTYDEKANLIPHIATSWSNPSPATWIFKIRKDVKFHNGRKMTAQDVAWSMNRMLDPATKVPRQQLYMVKSVVATDDETVRFELTDPFAPFLDILTHPSLSVMPKEAVAAAGDNFARRPVGTGPFKFVSWQSDQGVVLERNTDYWLGRPHLSRVVIRPIPETSVAEQQLETGDVHVIADVLPDDMGRLQKQGLLQVAPGFAYYYIALNMKPDATSMYKQFKKNPLADLRVRKAMAMAFDVEGAIKAIYPDLGGRIRAYAPLSPSSWAYDRAIESGAVSYNPAAAKRLLADAGYPNGLSLEILAMGDAARQSIAQILQYSLQQIGIKATIVSPEFGVLLARANAQDFDIGVFGWGGTPEPHYFLYPLLHSKNRGPGGNNAWYSNSDVDKWLEEAMETSDIAKRKGLYKNVLERAVADVPHIPLFWKPELLGVSPKVRGLVIDARGYYRLVKKNANVWMTQ